MEQLQRKEHRTGVSTEPSTIGSKSGIRLYTLALAGQPEGHEQAEGISRLTSGVKMAPGRTYALTGRTEVAGDLLDMRNTGTERNIQDITMEATCGMQAIIIHPFNTEKTGRGCPC